ncbi:PaaX family transcriptional regulator C-terminal domain-containing protein [Patulibacter sp. NPDC049589]|uniref:PaaX family transcriptional regulator n=1 Tax=Patulibacter sp. NPDC049589 TaxID=3154731 RepID=UPI003430801F
MDDGPAPLPAPSARALLVTVLGELVYPYEGPVWTAALIEVMRGLGVEEHAARQAIARGSAAGWIEAERHGRSARWTLADRGRRLIEDGMRRSAAFVEEPEPWDGRWLVLLVTVPQQQRAMRKRLYGALTWMGLGNPTPGVWLSPHAEAVDEARETVAELGLEASTLSFVGPVAGIGLSEDEIVRSAWDLEELGARYRALIDRYGDVDPAPGDEMLFTHIELLNALQRFLRLDPRLPVALLPDWVGREGGELFRSRRAAWSAPARARFREIAEAAGPG